MLNIQLFNEAYEYLQLTGDEANYQVIKVEGLNPVEAQLNMTTLAGVNGSRFNSSQLASREIVFTIVINGEVEANRDELYKYFQTGEMLRAIFKTDDKHVLVEGYVGTVECDPYDEKVTMQASLIVPESFFSDIEETVVEDSTSATFTVQNDGAETGLTIELTLISTASNVSKIILTNTTTGEAITIEDTTNKFGYGDIITFYTAPGEKNVTRTRNGTETSIINKIVMPSKFPQLVHGDNDFTTTYIGTSGGASVRAWFAKKYIGL